MRFEILESQLDTLVQRLDTQEMLTGRWKAHSQNTMAETPVGTLRRRVSSELPPPGFFANEAEARAFDTFQQAFGFFLNDAYVEKAMHELGVWNPNGTWYNGVNVKALDTYIGQVVEYLSQNKSSYNNLTLVRGGLRAEALQQTQQRTLDLLQALQHYAETVGITASNDTHRTK